MTAKSIPLHAKNENKGKREKRKFSNNQELFVIYGKFLPLFRIEERKKNPIPNFRHAVDCYYLPWRRTMQPAS